MKDDPLDAVYAYVERAYVRVQVGDVLIRCLEQGDAGPMQQMVESLVLAGPQNLGVLREMLSETEQRKMQLLDDQQQVFSELVKNLKSYGVGLGEFNNTQSVQTLTSESFLVLLGEAGIKDDEQQVTCFKLLRDSLDLMVSVGGHIRLMEEIEKYLQDWLWGMAYQSARQQGPGSGTPTNNQSL